MLYYDAIDVSEDANVTKISYSKKCHVYHYWFFKIKDLSFNCMYVCNGCHDVLMMSINLSDIAISKINVADYRCIISQITKIEAINILQNVDLSEKNGTL